MLGLSHELLLTYRSIQQTVPQFQTLVLRPPLALSDYMFAEYLSTCHD